MSSSIPKVVKLPLRYKNLDYNFIKEKDFFEAVEVISKSYTKGDPFSIAFGIKYDDYLEGLYLMKDDISNQNMSIIVRDPAINNQPAGCWLGIDLNVEHFKHRELSPQKWTSIYDAKLYVKNYLLKAGAVPKEKGKVWYTLSAGVCRTYIDRGIATNMLHIQESLAREKNFTHMCIETTSYVPKDIMKKNGFTAVFEEVYSKLELPGGIKLNLDAMKKDGFDPENETLCLLVKELKKDNATA